MPAGMRKTLTPRCLPTGAKCNLCGSTEHFKKNCPKDDTAPRKVRAWAHSSHTNRRHTDGGDAGQMGGALPRLQCRAHASVSDARGVTRNSKALLSRPVAFVANTRYKSNNAWAKHKEGPDCAAVASGTMAEYACRFFAQVRWNARAPDTCAKAACRLQTHTHNAVTNAPVRLSENRLPVLRLRPLSCSR